MPFPNNLNPLMAQFATANQPGAGINLPQFQQRYLPPQPTPPQAVTASDPYNQALSVFGAGLAQPIQANQTFAGNAATAALSGLDVMNADRAARNTAAQQLFDNQMTANNQAADQGSTYTGAAAANAQRDYYKGLIRNSGLADAADAQGDQNEHMLALMELAVKGGQTMLEQLGNYGLSTEEMAAIARDPNNLFIDLFKDLMTIAGGTPDARAMHTAMSNLIRKQQGYAQHRDEARIKFGVELPLLYKDFLSNKEEYEQQLRDAEAKQKTETLQEKETGSSKPSLWEKGAAGLGNLAAETFDWVTSPSSPSTDSNSGGVINQRNELQQSNIQSDLNSKVKSFNEPRWKILGIDLPLDMSNPTTRALIRNDYAGNFDFMSPNERVYWYKANAAALSAQERAEAEAIIARDREAGKGKSLSEILNQ